MGLSGHIAANYLLRQQSSVNQNGGLSGLAGLAGGAAIFKLPAGLEVAKKSLTSTMSSLYAMTIIVACLTFTATEIISDKVPLNYFESWGFYTYLYRLG